MQRDQLRHALRQIRMVVQEFRASRPRLWPITTMAGFANSGCLAMASKMTASSSDDRYNRPVMSACE
jgi:hypothetical protein